MNKYICIMKTEMTPRQFIEQYTEYFGDAAPLPIAIIYTDSPLGELRQIPGCMFKQIHRAYKGEAVTFSAENLACGGGRFYSGFTSAPKGVFNFVSLCEKYKVSPEIAEQSIRMIDVHPAVKPYLNFIRVDCLDTFDGIEGVIFLVTPEVMSGLFVWANFDSTDINAVQSPFGSGCSSTITSLVNENKRRGKHCFIGMFDVSARPYFRPTILSFSIPLSRFREMCATLSQCCVSGAPAWLKVRKRINHS